MFFDMFVRREHLKAQFRGYQLWEFFVILGYSLCYFPVFKSCQYDLPDSQTANRSSKAAIQGQGISIHNMADFFHSGIGENLVTHHRETIIAANTCCAFLVNQKEKIVIKNRWYRNVKVNLLEIRWKCCIQIRDCFDGGNICSQSHPSMLVFQNSEQQKGCWLPGSFRFLHFNQKSGEIKPFYLGCICLWRKIQTLCLCLITGQIFQRVRL